MKYLSFFSATALITLSLHAQNRVIVDPAEPLADFTSLAEWNTDGDAEGWTTNQLPPTVAGGTLSGTSDGGDTQLVNNPLAVPIVKGTPGIVTIEFSLQRSDTDFTPIQIFWNDAAGGFAAGRSLTLPTDQIPTDGLAHTYRFVIENLSTELRGLRIDGSQANPSDLSYDFVRIKVDSFGPTIDPDDPINVYFTLGEFDLEGEFLGWQSNNIDSPVVTGGNLSGLTLGNDPQFFTNGVDIDTTTGETDIVEIRLRRAMGDTSRIDLFWGDNDGGFAAVRRTTVPENTFPNDGQFHVIQFPIGEFFNGNLFALRIDPNADSADSIEVDIDYVRIGNLANDRDGDGLADSVETNTGVFVSAADTGTDPDDADSDNDTYNDGEEVASGTDPNDGMEFPAPIISGYSELVAEYLIDTAINDNVASVKFGIPVGFTIDPALPSGLNLNVINGTISGTPTSAMEATTYTVTADFGEGESDDIALNLAVFNPGIIRYSVNTSVFSIDSEITALTPVLRGPAPDSFGIAPALPGGLTFDTATGIISGTPIEITPALDYTVTADYADSPDASATISIRTKGVPVFLGRDADPLSTFTSLGEWETDGEVDGWNFARANATVTGGILAFDATGGDPIMSRGGVVDLAAGTILEIRLRQDDNEGVEFFWTDATGGPSPVRAFTIPGDQILNDGLFHIYQVNFEDVFVGNLSGMRVDPGNVGGRTVELDYIRIGSAAPPAAPGVTFFNYDSTFGEIEITWNSTQGASYRIESAAALDQEEWSIVRDDIAGDDGSTTFLGSPGNADRFFRIVR